MEGAEKNYGERFVDLLADERLSQLVTFPTFIQADGQFKNTLDYIICENKARIANVIHNPPLGSARQAHVVLNWEFYLRCKSTKKISSTNLDLNKANFNRIKADLSTTDWYTLFAN